MVRDNQEQKLNKVSNDLSSLGKFVQPDTEGDNPDQNIGGGMRGADNTSKGTNEASGKKGNSKEDMIRKNKEERNKIAKTRGALAQKIQPEELLKLQARVKLAEAQAENFESKKEKGEKIEPKSDTTTKKMAGKLVQALLSQQEEKSEDRKAKKKEPPAEKPIVVAQPAPILMTSIITSDKKEEERAISPVVAHYQKTEAKKEEMPKPEIKKETKIENEKMVFSFKVGQDGPEKKFKKGEEFEVKTNIIGELKYPEKIVPIKYKVEGVITGQDGKKRLQCSLVSKEYARKTTDKVALERTYEEFDARELKEGMENGWIKYQDAEFLKDLEEWKKQEKDKKKEPETILNQIAIGTKIKDESTGITYEVRKIPDKNGGEYTMKSSGNDKPVRLIAKQMEEMLESGLKNGKMSIIQKGSEKKKEEIKKAVLEKKVEWTEEKEEMLKKAGDTIIAEDKRIAEIDKLLAQMEKGSVKK